MKYTGLRTITARLTAVAQCRESYLDAHGYNPDAATLGYIVQGASFDGGGNLIEL